MCAQLGVCRQGYYRWLRQGASQRESTDAELTETIREIHTQLHGDPGVRRIWAELAVRGNSRTSRKRVWRRCAPPACTGATRGPGERPPSLVGDRSTPRT